MDRRAFLAAGAILMGNGFNGSGGTSRLWCREPSTGPRGGENDTPNRVAEIPNVNLGNFDLRSSMLMDNRMRGNDDTHSFGSVESNDFTLEFWVKRNFPDSITNWQTSAAAATGYCVSGVVSLDSGSTGAEIFIAGSSGATRTDGAGIQFRGANFESFYQEIGSTFVSTTMTLGFGWHHVAITYDRSGNMTTYLDGTSYGTQSINATSLTNGEFGAMYCNITDQASSSGKAEAPYMLAGMAAHEVILTAAQIQSSAKNITFQALGANTYFAFFYGSIELKRSAWTSLSSETPATQAETLAIFTSDIRSELLTIVADARSEVVEVTALNTDTDNGGIDGAVQLPDKNSDTSGDTVEPYATCENLNIGGTVGNTGFIGIGPGIGNFENDETESTFYSPALGYDEEWPPMRGTAGTDYA